jgi:hypothetical protein
MIVAVFVPSLIGVGILVSGAILLTDLLRRYLPQGGLRRRHRVAMGAYHVVSEAAGWAGRTVSAGDLLDRAPRHRLTYVVWGTICGVMAVAAPYAFVEAHEDELGLFFQSHWMVILSFASAIGLGLVAVVLFGVALLAPSGRQPVAWLVANTVIGRIQVPDPLTFDHSPEGASCAER